MTPIELRSHHCNCGNAHVLRQTREELVPKDGTHQPCPACKAPRHHICYTIREDDAGQFRVTFHDDLVHRSRTVAQRQGPSESPSA